MSKYYEQIKSNYSRDIDHLVTFNNNGLWIKENLSNGSRIITADKYDGKKSEEHHYLWCFVEGQWVTQVFRVRSLVLFVR